MKLVILKDLIELLKTCIYIFIFKTHRENIYLSINVHNVIKKCMLVILWLAVHRTLVELGVVSF